MSLGNVQKRRHQKDKVSQPDMDMEIQEDISHDSPIGRDAGSEQYRETKTLGRTGFIRRIKKTLRPKKNKGGKNIKKKELLQQNEEHCKTITDLKTQLKDKRLELAVLQSQTQELIDLIDKHLSKKTGHSGNIIVGDENVMINVVDLSPTKRKLNSLIQMCSDEFSAVVERHAELRWRMETMQSVLDNVNSKLVLIQCSDEKIKSMMVKLTEARNLIDDMRGNCITEDFILEAADAFKYQTEFEDFFERTLMPEKSLKLARYLAIKYVAKPERLFAAFSGVGIHPLGERLTPDGLGDACAQWLALWMEEHTPKELVDRLKQLEIEVLQDETDKIRQKVHTGMSLNNLVSSFCDVTPQDGDGNNLNAMNIFSDTTEDITWTFQKFEMDELFSDESFTWAKSVADMDVETCL